MTLHDKLAARLHKYSKMAWCYDVGEGDYAFDDEMSVEDVLNTVANEIKRGDFDDVLGAREPTIDDVKREAARVFGEAKEYGGALVYYLDNGVHVGVGSKVRGQHVEVYPVIAPTIAAAYAALRALPDWKEEE